MARIMLMGSFVWVEVDWAARCVIFRISSSDDFIKLQYVAFVILYSVGFGVAPSTVSRLSFVL